MAAEMKLSAHDGSTWGGGEGRGDGGGAGREQKEQGCSVGCALPAHSPPRAALTPVVRVCVCMCMWWGPGCLPAEFLSQITILGKGP